MEAIPQVLKLKISLTTMNVTLAALAHSKNLLFESTN